MRYISLPTLTCEMQMYMCGSVYDACVCMHLCLIVFKYMFVQACVCVCWVCLMHLCALPLSSCRLCNPLIKWMPVDIPSQSFLQALLWNAAHICNDTVTSYIRIFRSKTVVDSFQV